MTAKNKNTNPQYRAAYATGYAAGKAFVERTIAFDIRAQIAAGFDVVHERLDRVERDVHKAATLVDYVRRDPAANAQRRNPLFFTRLRALLAGLLPW